MPAHHTVALKIRTDLDLGRKLRHLIRRNGPAGSPEGRKDRRNSKMVKAMMTHFPTARANRVPVNHVSRAPITAALCASHPNGHRW